VLGPGMCACCCCGRLVVRSNECPLFCGPPFLSARWQFVPASGVRWGQRKCRPGRHLGGEVVHLANPTSVTCSAYRDNDDCALCNRLRCGLPFISAIPLGDLAPLPWRGFFCGRALCNHAAGLSANLLGVAHNLSDGRCWPGKPTLPLRRMPSRDSVEPDAACPPSKKH
jgi:hypothetical protein